jgi:hypothetical protein
VSSEPLRGISFHLKGADPDSDLVRAGDLVAFIGRLLAALSAIDVAKNARETRFYRIAAFSVASASATLEETVEERLRSRSDTYHDVGPALAELLECFSRTVVPPWADSDVLIKFRELAEPITHLAYAAVGVGEERYALDDEYRAKVELAVGRDLVTVGDLVGTFEAVNLHNRNRYRATLYSAVNDPVACEFAPSLREKIVDSLNKRVRVHGRLRRRANSGWPYQVQVLDLERMPDEADLPLFADLYGASRRTFPSDIDPVDYVRSLRDEDD